jgi:2-methylcitrate dehydratase PrpD
MSFSSRFARFVTESRGPSFPARARRLAVDGVTDAIGCMFAGASQPIATRIRRVIGFSPEPISTLEVPCPAARGFTTPADAALYGATLTHALDYDDVNHPGLAHPSAIIVPALMALSPTAGPSGRDMVTAYICGVEMLGKLGSVLNPALFETGWHPTPALGPIAVATAAASLLGLGEQQTVTALSIAASAAAGLRANFGTMTKPLHAGQASRAGTVAALLARDGFSAAEDALDHKFGYFSLFGVRGDRNDPCDVQPGLGLEIVSKRGLEIKPYPACAAAQPAIEAGIRLHDELSGRGVRHVTVRTGQPTMLPMIYDRPVTSLEGKFSLSYCLAQAIVTGRCVIDSFSPERIEDPRIADTRERVSIDVDDALRYDYQFGVSVRVETEDGITLGADVPQAKGTIDRPMSDLEVGAKFRDCTRAMMDAQASARLLTRLRELDSEGPVTDLVSELSGL